MDELEKVDIIKERAGVSYKEAKEALDESGGDVVQALIFLEEKERSFVKRLQDRGNQVIGQVKTYVDKGSQRKIKIKKDEKTLLEVPATVGALGIVGALLAPEIAVVGAIGAVAAKLNFELVPKEDDDEVHDIEVVEVVKDKSKGDI